MKYYTILYGGTEHTIEAKHMVYCKDLVVFMKAGEPIWSNDNELINRDSVVAIFSAHQLSLRKISNK